MTARFNHTIFASIDLTLPWLSPLSGIDKLRGQDALFPHLPIRSAPV
ncbi:hypothetical protein [Dietzia timorensis]|uniref:Uncharacterized protein n=1 Tax=Dietzia timorensis TaxID=499555 RepID=A0A173LHM7_9ACTN|nr:hypothetical protein [Dietzia timorensis]ANI91104.1 Hypothetical protein BJL86_0294 [Dietzia timorensis]